VSTPIGTFNKKNVILITVVASFGGLLFGYDTAVISGAVGALENYFITKLENDSNLAITAILQFKIIISLCILAIGLLFGSFILKFFKKSTAYLVLAIIVGAINMIFTVVAIFTVDKFGRKKLMMIGSGFMAVSMIGLGFALFSGSTGMLALLLMLVYIAAFAMSWGPVTWVLLSEIFPNSIKGVMAVAVAIQWLANLLVSWTFPMMNNNTGLVDMFNHGFPYWIYGGMAVLSGLFIWRFVPETKGKTLEDMENLWRPTKKIKVKI